MTTNYLVLTDVDAIQSYVFSSVRMAMMVGASQIVRVADKHLEHLASKQGALLAVASGGVGLFVFQRESDAKAFALQAEAEFADFSINGTLAASQVVAFDDGLPKGHENGFARKRDQALNSLEVRKRLGQRTSEPVALGMAWVCTTCGADRAVDRVNRPGGEPPWRVCRACLHRFRECKNATGRQLDYYGLHKTSPDGTLLNVDIDFDTLCPDGPWGLVALDGDGLGDRLQTLDSPSEFQTFSRNLDQLIREAISSGLQAIHEIRPSSIAPAIVLFDGGDDILVACRGELALPFVLSFAERVQAEPNWSWANGQIGFSAGVAIVGRGFPFRTAHRIAEGLLRNAKRAAHKARQVADTADAWSEGAVDFAIVSESFGEASEILKEREVVDKHGRLSVQLTGRPYRLATSGSRSLSRLKSACDLLTDFPASRLSELRNHLTRSAMTSESELTPAGVHRILEDSIKPFLMTWGIRTCRSKQLKTCWHDAMSKLDGFNEDEFPQADLADAMNLWGSA